MVMRRYGRLATLFWTQVNLVDLQRVFYLFMRSLAFGIIIHGRRYVCTYIENICWYFIILPSFQSEKLISGYSNAMPHCFLRVCLIVTIAKWIMTYLRTILAPVPKLL